MEQQLGVLEWAKMDSVEAAKDRQELRRLSKDVT
jgi:hypothetical protein